MSAVVSRDSRTISAADFTGRGLMGGSGIIVVAVPVVAWVVAIPIDGIVLWFDYSEINWHNDCHNNQSNSSGSKDPDEGSLVERFGPPGLGIGRTTETLLTGLRKQGGGVGDGVVREVRAVWGG